jgi:hypothetical protein
MSLLARSLALIATALLAISAYAADPRHRAAVV